MALSLSCLQDSGAAAPHSGVALSDWLGIPLANDSCRVVLAMAAKRQKLRENIIEFSLFTVAVRCGQTKRAPVDCRTETCWVCFLLGSFTHGWTLPHGQKEEETNESVRHVNISALSLAQEKLDLDQPSRKPLPTRHSLESSSEFPL